MVSARGQRPMVVPQSRLLEVLLSSGALLECSSLSVDGVTVFSHVLHAPEQATFECVTHSFHFRLVPRDLGMDVVLVCLLTALLPAAVVFEEVCHL